MLFTKETWAGFEAIYDHVVEPPREQTDDTTQMKQILDFLTASLASWNEEVEKTSPSSTKEKTALELYESALLSLRPVKKEDGPLGATVATAQPDGNGKAGGEEAATLENATPIQTAPVDGSSG